jgi:hypothetical protein
MFKNYQGSSASLEGCSGRFEAYATPDFGWNVTVGVVPSRRRLPPSPAFASPPPTQSLPPSLGLLELPQPCCSAQAAFPWKNRPLQNKGRVIYHNVNRSSLISRLPHRHTRVNCHRPRWRQTAVAPGASRANHAPAQAHQMPEVIFCASPSAASAAAPRLRCRGMFSVSLWASAPHVPLCGVCVPSTGHCACRYAHGPHVVELG